MKGTGSLDDMAVFAAIVREGSFTAGARALGVTKQSASERVARLEARLGVQLLVRSTRRLSVTEIGAEYARACAEIVASADAANLMAHHAQRHPTGQVRVTCPVGLSRPLVMPAIDDYRRVHPGVTFDVVIEERVLDLVKEGIDLAIRVGTTSSSPAYVARPLFSSDAVFVASREFIARHGEPRTAADARRLPMITRRGERTWTIHDEEIAVTGAVVGIFLGVKGQEFSDELRQLQAERDDICSGAEESTACRQQDANIETARDNGRKANLGLGLSLGIGGGLGLVALTAGAILFVQGNRRTAEWKRTGVARHQLRIVPTGRGLAFSGRF